MYRLYGFSLSNYYNLVKLTLLEKGLPFEEVPVFPPPKPEFLQKSPLGKIPCLEIEAGRYLSESQVILDYLEDTHPEPALYPEDPYARAKVRELMRVMELYLELPARRLYAQAFFRRHRERRDPRAGARADRKSRRRLRSDGSLRGSSRRWGTQLGRSGGRHPPAAGVARHAPDLR